MSIFNYLRRKNPQQAKAMMEPEAEAPRPTLPDVIEVSLSGAFYNKQERGDTVEILPDDCKPIFSQSFRHMEVTPGRFVATIADGNAFAVGVYHDEHRVKSKFISSQILALDFDDGVSPRDLLDFDFTRHFAYFLYPSPSSTAKLPKTRLIAILDTKITDSAHWELLQQTLIDIYAPFTPDAQCKDCARFYYGSDKKGAYILRRNVLPVDVLLSSSEYRLIQQRKRDAIRKRELAQQRTIDAPITDTAITALIDTVTRNLALAGSGERNDALFKATCYLMDKKREEGWQITDPQLEADLLRSCHANGLVNDDGEHTVQATIKSAIRRA